MQTYRDADDVSDDDVLLRRITPSQHMHVLPNGTRVLTGFAFREKTHQCSFYISKETTHEKILSCGFPTQEIVEVRAGDVRALGYVIVRDPDECDNSHTFSQATGYKSKGQIEKDCKALAEIVNASSESKGAPPVQAAVAPES